MEKLIINAFRLLFIGVNVYLFMSIGWKWFGILALILVFSAIFDVIVDYFMGE